MFLSLTKPAYYPYLRHFILMTSRRTEAETVNRMQKAGLDHSVVVTAISQRRRCLSACVRAHAGKCWAHFVVFLWSVCYVSAGNFWIWGFTVWLFCLSPKRNLSETFYQVWALRRWRGRHNYRQTRSCLLNPVQKIGAFTVVVVRWCYSKKWLALFFFVVTLYFLLLAVTKDLKTYLQISLFFFFSYACH